MARATQFERGVSAQEMGDVHAEQRSAFQERVTRGAYRELYDPPLRSVIQEGASIGGLGEELGAVRYALAKLMAEEEDPVKLAGGVARLAAAAAQLLKVIRPVANESEDAAIQTISRILIDLEKEARSSRQAGRPAPSIAAPRMPTLE